MLLPPILPQPYADPPLLPPYLHWWLVFSPLLPVQELSCFSYTAMRLRVQSLSALGHCARAAPNMPAQLHQRRVCTGSSLGWNDMPELHLHHARSCCAGLAAPAQPSHHGQVRCVALNSKGEQNRDLISRAYMPLQSSCKLLTQEQIQVREDP